MAKWSNQRKKGEKNNGTELCQEKGKRKEKERKETRKRTEREKKKKEEENEEEENNRAELCPAQVKLV